MDNLKVPPYNLEAEQSVLGSMLLSQDAVIVATEQLQPEDFYMESHRRILMLFQGFTKIENPST